MALNIAPSALVGQMLVGGFLGPVMPASFARALTEKRRGGAILFKRNVPSVAAASDLCAAILEASPRDLPPFLGVDQEGGRVVRLPSPVLRLPAMSELASFGDVELVSAAALAVGTELAAIGFNLNFAPVLDVNTQPSNPVIGDRAFGSDAATVARFGVAYLRSLQQAGVLACGKHFPGHGDTQVDSHLELPMVSHQRARLDQIELAPFRAAIAAGVASLMSAHVVYDLLDPGVPATLSPLLCGQLLRDELGFQGVLFSDDMEMKAIAARWPIEEAAVAAIEAGCDALLICSDEETQERAHLALVHQVERDARFRERCVRSVERLVRVRRASPPRPIAINEGLLALIGGPKSRDVAARIDQQRASKST